MNKIKINKSKISDYGPRCIRDAIRALQEVDDIKSDPDFFKLIVAETNKRDTESDFTKLFVKMSEEEIQERIVHPKHNWFHVCVKCKNTLELNEAPDCIPRCCDEYMNRIFPKGKRVSVLGKPYLRTKYSDSLAVSMNQIAEHKKMFPDVKVDAEGRPGFDNVQQQDRYLEASGMIKHPQKIKKLKQLT